MVMDTALLVMMAIALISISTMGKMVMLRMMLRSPNCKLQNRTTPGLNVTILNHLRLTMKTFRVTLEAGIRMLLPPRESNTLKLILMRLSVYLTV
jgi:hypothetical protein